MSRELKQVDVRLKLTDKESMFSRETIDTPEKAVSVLAPVLAELDREEVCVVNLDGKGHPINFSVVSIGSVNYSLITGIQICHFVECGSYHYDSQSPIIGSSNEQTGS